MVSFLHNSVSARVLNNGFAKTGKSNMLKNSTISNSQQPATIIDDHFLSIMTALFIEGVAIEQPAEQSRDIPDGHFPQSDSQDHLSELHLSCAKETETIALKEYGTRKAEPHHQNRRTREDQATKTIRNFILGLSDAFNNLLMGIWGNLSLINLSTDKSKPICARALEMEQLIQNGSALLNGIFGYLGERRLVAKNIRLNQLIREINESIPIDSGLIKSNILQHKHLDTGGQNTAGLIASGLARVLLQLMERLQFHFDLIRKEDVLIEENCSRLQTIERLMHRAMEIIEQLQFYAGTVECRFEKLNMKTLAKRIASKFEKSHPHLNLCIRSAGNMPRVYADRSLMHFVLNELMANAADAMPEKGDLQVDVRPLTSEAPQNRCIARRWADSIVITISDSGHGMDLDTLLHVFDPYFTSRRKASHLGMGLAASWGIIKAHGGYIHVRSKKGFGSAVKVYLPVG